MPWNPIKQAGVSAISNSLGLVAMLPKKGRIIPILPMVLGMPLPRLFLGTQSPSASIRSVST
jgi:hypothetical protein